MFIICFLLVFSGSLMLQMLSFVVSRFTFSVFFLCTNCWPRIPLGSNQMAVANAAANVGQVFFLFRDSGVLKHVVYLSHPSFDSWNRCSFFSEHSLCCTLCPVMTSWSISQHKIIVTFFFCCFFLPISPQRWFCPSCLSSFKKGCTLLDICLFFSSSVCPIYMHISVST